jgi:hypothetical protein
MLDRYTTGLPIILEKRKLPCNNLNDKSKRLFAPSLFGSFFYAVAFLAARVPVFTAP